MYVYRKKNKYVLVRVSTKGNFFVKGCPNQRREREGAR